jgi:hypothetical protein
VSHGIRQQEDRAISRLGSAFKFGPVLDQQLGEFYMTRVACVMKGSEALFGGFGSGLGLGCGLELALLLRGWNAE